MFAKLTKIVFWIYKFGDEDLKVYEALNKLILAYSPERHYITSAFSVDGKQLKNVGISGLMVSKSVIWCHAQQDEKISGTSTVHELVHIALANSINSADADHEGPKYPGWTSKHTELIKATNTNLEILGL